MPNIEQMMEQISKNPKTMALVEAIKKNPKILMAVQDFVTTLAKKGYIDLSNPTKQPSIAMLADSEIRSKLFLLVKMLTQEGVLNFKDGTNQTDAVSNIMGLLMPPVAKEDSKQNATYTHTVTETKDDHSEKDTVVAWSDKLKKMFKS
ncbi:unnamed protein product [Didymodactylos carnosus]|uniref:Uncharacterized protein n=1 Tax=Didymodactylos carnosus TaxID=1234261 RepID=A0A815YG52_9BILA|nr:unnamed protein product [Didymodactylos carnosus]CAF4433584.1 unnamed protein product [Didymodactylos carnosus]